MTKRTPGPEPFHSPFSKLKLKVPQQPAQPKPAPAPRDRRPATADSEAALFLEAMGEVATLKPDAKHVDPSATPRVDPTALAHDEAESLAQLAQLVAADAPLEVSGAEGWAPGLDPQVLKRLRAGAYRLDARLAQAGQSAAEQFLSQARRDGHRCVEVPLQAVPWLTRGRLSRHLLAFCPAAPAGAVWVLLRR